MQTLRTRIPHLIQMLMDKGVTLTFGSKDGEPLIGFRYPNGGSGHTHLYPGYIRGDYGANALAIERELVMIFADLGPSRKNNTAGGGE